jgi:hypothetical protein
MKKILIFTVLVGFVCSTVFASGANEEDENGLTLFERNNLWGSLIYIEGAKDLVQTRDVVLMVFKELPEDNNYPINYAISKVNPSGFENRSGWALRHVDPNRNLFGNDKPWIRSGDFFIAFLEIEGDNREIHSFDEAFIYCGRGNIPKIYTFRELRDTSRERFAFQYYEFKKYSEVKN